MRGESEAPFHIRGNVIEGTTQAARTRAKQRPESPPAATAATAARAKALCAALAKPVNFLGFEADPKRTLQETLDDLANRYDLTFDVLKKQ